MPLTCGRSGNRLARFARRFSRSDGGAVAIYVTITAAVMVGFGALVIDLSRLFTVQTELQKAVDASALSAAAELDGTAGAIARATAAAKDALVNNRQTFASGGLEVDFADSDIRFLHSLPVDDDSPITSAYVTGNDNEARYVEVRASARTVDYLLAPALSQRIGGDGSAPESDQTAAVAVAGFNQVVCDFPPLMICNPAEVNGNIGAPFDPIPGQLIVLKDKGGASLWEPGNFGLLDPAQGNQGTAELVEQLATADPSGCFSALVDLRTGSAQNPVSKGINVRFDMYETPGFGGNANNNPNYRPAPNVTKGKYKQSGTFVDYTGNPPKGMGMPQHDCLDAGNCDTMAPAHHERFAPPPGWPTPNPANQRTFWEEYWAINHPDSGSFLSMVNLIDANGDGYVTRKEMYDWEIDNNEITENVDNAETDQSDADGENGHPMHYTGSVAPEQARREVPVAVLNCIADGPMNGNTENVPVIAFAKMFLTRPAEDGSQQTIFAEIIDVLQVGVDDVLHDVVQLYR